MILDIKAEQNLEVKYETCPRCHKPYDKGKHTRTKHHVIPLFMNPQTEVTITLCKECHEELNGYYNHQSLAHRKFRYKTESFTDFMARYNELRDKFYKRELTRGEFGEGLWSNLVTYLESIQK